MKRRFYYPLILLALGLFCVGGCSMLMPKELRASDRRAAAFEKAHPEAFSTRGELKLAQVGTVERPTLVLLHGAPGDWAAWAEVLADPELSERFTILAPDRPGYGGSRPGQVEGSMAAQAAELVQLVADREGPILWAGHSFGVSIAARVAMDFPDQVDGLLFVAGAMSPEYERKKWYHSLGDTWVARRILPAGLDVANQEAIAFEAELEDMVPLWKKIECPTLILHCRTDGLADFRHVAFTQAHMTNAPLETVVFESGGHFILWNRHDDIKAGILRLQEMVEDDRTGR